MGSGGWWVVSKLDCVDTDGLQSIVSVLCIAYIYIFSEPMYSTYVVRRPQHDFRRIYVNNINCRLCTYYKVTTVGGFGCSEDCEKMPDLHLLGGGGYRKARLNRVFLVLNIFN